MREFLFDFIEHNGPVILLMAIFFTGFIAKIILYYLYDFEIENVYYMHNARKGIVSHVLLGYRERCEFGDEIKNTRIFVDNMINSWKIFGISAGRMENIAELCAYICIVIGAFFDMVLLTQKETILQNRASIDVMTCVYVYTAMGIICYAVLKAWESIINSSYKRNYLSVALTDCIDNQMGMIDLIEDEAENSDNETSQRVKENNKQQTELDRKELIKESKGKQIHNKELSKDEFNNKEQEVNTKKSEAKMLKTRLLNKVKTEKNDGKNKDEQKSKEDIKNKDEQKSKEDIKNKDEQKSKEDIKNKDEQKSKEDIKNKNEQKSKKDIKNKKGQKSENDKKEDIGIIKPETIYLENEDDKENSIRKDEIADEQKQTNKNKDSIQNKKTANATLNEKDTESIKSENKEPKPEVRHKNILNEEMQITKIDNINEKRNSENQVIVKKKMNSNNQQNEDTNIHDNKMNHLTMERESVIEQVLDEFLA